jgi:hypothetical protein
MKIICETVILVTKFLYTKYYMLKLGTFVCPNQGILSELHISYDALLQNLNSTR